MEALAQLADLRLRQGRIEEADALLDLIDDTECATLAAAALRLARGETGVATGLLQRRLTSSRSLACGPGPKPSPSPPNTPLSRGGDGSTVAAVLKPPPARPDTC